MYIGLFKKTKVQTSKNIKMLIDFVSTMIVTILII